MPSAYQLNREELFEHWVEDFSAGPLQVIVRNVGDQWRDSDWSMKDIATMFMTQVSAEAMRAAFYAGMFAGQARSASD